PVTYALRLLPPGDGTGGLLVATPENVIRVGPDGRVLTTYDVPNLDSWFALNITPGGTEMWSATPGNGRIYKWNIASGLRVALPGHGLNGIPSGAGETEPGSGRYTLDGLCVMGEYVAAQEICGNLIDDDGDGLIDEICTPIEVCSNQSPGDDDGDGLVDANDPDCGAVDFCKADDFTPSNVAGFCARKNFEGEVVRLLPAPGPPSQQQLREVFNVTGLPPGLTFDAGTGIVTGTPSYDIRTNFDSPNTRVYAVTYTVQWRQLSGGELVSSFTQSFNWTIENVNRPPLAVNDSAITRPGLPVSVAVLANDTDADAGDVLTITSNTPVSPNGTYARSGNTYTFTPNVGFVGIDTFSYSIADGFGGTATASVTINVVNQAPIAVNDARTVRPGQAVSINVLTNDSDPDNSPDVFPSGPDPMTVTSHTQPSRGTITQSPNGTFTYTSSLTPPVYLGTDSFTYTIADSYGGSATATVTITIVNSPPVAVDDAATTRPGQAVTIAVLTQGTPDSDPDSDTLTVTGSTTPSNGTRVQNVNNTFTYTPALTFTGTDSFTYTISDGFGGTSTATVRITVVNRPPVAVDDVATTRPGQAVTIAVLTLGTPDSDPDSDTLSVTSSTAPTAGTRVLNANNTFTYTPPLTFTGTATFTYTISDGFGGTATATVTITVNNKPPVAVNDTVTTIAGRPTASFSVLTMGTPDSDPDGDPLSLTLVSTPANGTLTRTGNSFVFTPNPGFAGVTTFTYTITDGFGGTSTATVTINVINLPPVATNDTGTARGSNPVAISVMSNDSDPDSHVIAVTGATTPPNGTAVVNANGTITYTANAGFQGTDTFFYTIRDGYGGESTAQVTITVGPPNRFDDCTCAAAKASPGEIWPPNHKQTQVVNVTGLVDPQGGAPLAIRILGIYQDEPTNYLGDGNTAIDAGGVGTGSAWVRAERTGNPNVPGNGRVYEIVFEATAPDGSACQGKVFTGVPHDQGQGNYIFDDGIRYDSTVAGGPIVRNALRIQNNLSDADVAATSFVPKYVGEARIGGGGATRELQIGPTAAAPVDSKDFAWTSGEQVTFLLWRSGSTTHFKLITNQQFEYVAYDVDCANGQCNDIFLRAQSGGTGKLTLSSLNINGLAVPDTLTIPVGGAAQSMRLSGLSLDEGMLFGGLAKIEWTSPQPAGSTVNFRVQVGKACPTQGGTGGGGTGTPPLARSDSYTTNEDTPLNVSAATGVLQNDLTFGGALTTTLVDTASHGTLTLNGDGSFTYVPAPQYSGQDTFRYR
ncbi:MAG: Ig-like domain-containing protein, partial [Acidobacteriota bacterium]|nr:Ig-like domain-containing protein [Acidobacteriota bacterium]